MSHRKNRRGTPTSTPLCATSVSKVSRLIGGQVSDSYYASFPKLALGISGM